MNKTDQFECSMVLQYAGTHRIMKRSICSETYLSDHNLKDCVPGI